MPCEDNNDQLRDDLQQAVQILNLPGFNPGMLAGITCSNLFEKTIWEMLSNFVDCPATNNLPTYCVTLIHSIYNYNRTDPILHNKGCINFERFPCRKTCGFCGGKFLFSN